LFEEKHPFKFVSVNINDKGKFEYKSQWRESENVDLGFIKHTLKEAVYLIKRINKDDDTKEKFRIPDVSEFRFSLLNAIQSFEIPTGQAMDHNDLTNFSRMFFPFVGIISQPKKRKGGKYATEGGKFGTYLNYNRISKYEQNFETKIEQRINDLLNNYQITEEKLVEIVSGNFNITDEKTRFHIEQAQKKNTFYRKRGGKELKKLESLPTFKIPGIKVDIQGKKQKSYIFRMFGVRSEFQLFRIISFVNILIYLYVEIYLKKNKDKLFIKDFLKDLSNIAERRSQVEQIVETKETKTNIKFLSNIDKERFGFTPLPGKNNYSRNCGKNKQPKAFVSTQLGELEKLGYVFDAELDTYVYKGKTKKGKDTTLRTVKLKNKTTGENIYYACDPDEKNKNRYIGFLKKNDHPKKMCMPCCFKTDHRQSNSAKIRNRYYLCTGQQQIERKKSGELNFEYILQDTNKMDPDRFGFLPPKLDLWLNKATGKTKKMSDFHHITETNGYILKMGILQDKNNFLRAIGKCFDLDVGAIKKKVVNVLTGKNGNSVFYSLNNGGVKIVYDTLKNYTNIVLNNNTTEFGDLIDVLSIPGVLDAKGVNILIIEKNVKIIAVEDESQDMKKVDDYNVICQNPENMDNMYDKERKTIILLKENIQFNPLLLFKKSKKNSHELITHYRHNDDVVKQILDFYKLNCRQSIQRIENRVVLTAKYVSGKLGMPKHQIIDDYYKCVYLVMKDGNMIPTEPSGCLYNIPVETIDKVGKYIRKLKDTYSYLAKLAKTIPEYMPRRITYLKQKGNNFLISYLITHSRNYIKVKEENVSGTILKKYGLKIQEEIIVDDEIDKYIRKGEGSGLIDERTIIANKEQYNYESYQLFKLNVSKYLSRNVAVKKQISKLDKNTPKVKELLSKILREIVSKEMIVVDKMPDLKNYVMQNRRVITYNVKEVDCDKFNFKWTKRGCRLMIYKKNVEYFVNKLIFELLYQEVSRNEILEVGDYFVSTVVNREVFTARDNEIILNSDNPRWNLIISGLFQGGLQITSKIEQKQIQSDLHISQEMNKDFPLTLRKPFYLQKIVAGDNNLYRTFANCVYWIINDYEANDIRNLGYIHNMQTQLSNYFKGNVLNYLYKNKDKQKMWREVINKQEELTVKLVGKSAKSNFEGIEKYADTLSKQKGQFSLQMLDVFILEHLYKYPIFVYNQFYELLYYVANGKIFFENKSKIDKKKSIHIKMTFMQSSVVPSNIDALYYYS
jgi:hypothetical protein